MAKRQVTVKDPGAQTVKGKLKPDLLRGYKHIHVKTTKLLKDSSSSKYI